MIHSMECNNRTIHLIDTPGFNDTGRSDGETLQELAFWLAAAHERELKLSGIIYLHPINATRLQGSGVRSLNAFKKMVGETNYRGVIVATTRWDEVASDQMNFASQRERELRVKLADVVEKGGRVVSLSAGRIDAMKIVAHIASRSQEERLTLAFQRQLVEEELAIHETDAGKFLFEKLETHTTQVENTLEESQSALMEMFNSGKANGFAQASKWQNDTRQSLKPLEEDMERMKKKLKDVRESWEEKLRKEAEALAEAKKANEEQLAQKTEELSRVQNHLRSPSPTDGASRSSLNQEFIPSMPDFLMPSNGTGYRTTRSASPSSAYSTPTFNRQSPTPSSIVSEASLLREIEDLGHQQELMEMQQHRRLDNRYTKQPGHNSAWGVVGTSLAVAQVVAAMACTVM